MSSRNLVKLFFTTLILGGVTAGIVGFIDQWDKFQPLFVSFEVGEILSAFIWMVGVGFIFSVLSQAGFFAYLSIHRLGLGIFKTVSLWNAVQLVLVGFVMFDLVYIRYAVFGEGEGVGSYIGLALCVLIPALIVAYIKMKKTNKQAFVPALFFMTVVTVLEWTPILRANDESWIFFMLIPLLVCNTYQLLILGKINEKSQAELAKKKRVSN